MATTHNDVPSAGNVAMLVNRLSKVDISLQRPTTVDQPKKQFQVVAYPYKAQQADELDLEVDDIVEVMSHIEDGWNKGKLQKNGKVGMYPTNYCQNHKGSNSGGYKSVIKTSTTSFPKKEMDMPIHGDEQPSATKRVSSIDITAPSSTSPLPSTLHSSTSSTKSAAKGDEDTKEYAKVTFVYEAQHEDELSLSEVGQLILITKKNTGDPGWYEGQVNGRKGLFPDNFVELVKTLPSSSHPPLPSSSPPNSSTTLPVVPSTSSSRLNDKPPAVLPGAVPVMPLPPQVPAKPPKNVLSVSTTSLSTTGRSSSTQGNVASKGALFGAGSNNNKGEEEKATKPVLGGSFAQKKAALLASLPMHNPAKGNPPLRPAAPITSNHSSDDTQRISFDVEPIPPAQLNHMTKSRPKVPVGNRRPVSMFPRSDNDFPSSYDGEKDSTSSMSRSEIVLNNEPLPVLPSPEKPVNRPSQSSSGPSISPSRNGDSTLTPVISPNTTPISSTATFNATFVVHKEKEMSSSALGGSRSSTESANVSPFFSSSFTTPGTSNSHNVNPPPPSSEWVSRKEYNELEKRMRDLEERLSQLERRG